MMKREKPTMIGKFHRSRWVRLGPALGVLFALAFASPAWATLATTPCTAGPTAMSNYLGAGNGCTAGNFQFSNFAFVTASGSINGVTLTPTTGGEAQPNGTNVFEQLAPVIGIRATSTANAATCDSNTNDNGFCVQGKLTSLVSSITYLETAVAGLIGQIGMGATMTTHSSGGGGANAIAFREFCPGAVTFTQGCAGYGVIQIGIVNGGFNTLTASGGATFGGVANVAIRDTVYLTTTNGSESFAYVSNFDFTADAPEPATYGMVGLALAGLGAMGARRRKKPATPASGLPESG